MNPISIAAYRERAARAVVRERSQALRLPDSVFLAEGFAGERVLADLAVSAAGADTALVVLARFAAVRALSDHGPAPAPDTAAAEAWAAVAGPSRELSALRAARAAEPDSALRYRSLVCAAEQATALGHNGGAFALFCLAHETACRALRRAAAVRAAAGAARAAEAAGAAVTARIWTRRAQRTRRTEPDS